VEKIKLELCLSNELSLWLFLVVFHGERTEFFDEKQSEASAKRTHLLLAAASV